jgi:hypothetical protein
MIETRNILCMDQQTEVTWRQSSFKHSPLTSTPLNIDNSIILQANTWNKLSSP